MDSRKGLSLVPDDLAHIKLLEKSDCKHLINNFNYESFHYRR